MTAFVDTNVLVRHLTGDPSTSALRATSYLVRETGLLLVDVIAAEVIYVLESVYKTPRAQVATTMGALLAMPSLLVVDRPLLLRAIEVYERDRLDFADAYLVACAETTGVGTIASFDRSIDRVQTVRRLEP